MKRILQFLVLGVMMVGVSQSAAAQSLASQICDTDDSTTFSSTIPYPETAANIYIRAGRTEDAVQGRLYYQRLYNDTATDCELLEEVQLSTTTWQPVGRLPQSSGAPSIRLVLKIDRASDSLAGANAPILLLAEDSLPCQLLTDCVVEYAGENFTVLPSTLSYSTDSLQVGQLFDPTDDDILSVIYSVDGKQVYTTPDLESFNKGYVGIGRHTIGRTLVFASGQSLHDTQEVENDFSLTQLFSAVYYQNRNLLVVAGLIVGLLLMLQLSLWLLRFLGRRRRWRLSHGLDASSQTIKKTDRSAGARPNAEFEISVFDQIWRHKRITLGMIAGVVTIFLVSTMVISRFKVEGESMEPTLRNGSNQAILLLPAKLARFTGSAYIPDRGAVVVLKRPEFRALDSSQVVDTQSYVVKRVIGLPHERLVIAGGVITVFNASNPDGFVPDTTFNWTPNTQGSEGLQIDVTLQDNEIFVVGDNRSGSVDSRYYGPVRSDEIVGRVLSR